MSYRTYKEDSYFIPDELYEMIRWNRPAELHARLKRISYVRLALRVIESRQEGEISILILASLYGLEDFVRTLLSWDSSPEHVELRGNVYNVSGNLVEGVTALWCALNQGHYDVASILINEGNAHVFCGPHNSSVEYFIHRGRLDVVQFLFKRGYVTMKKPQIADNSHYFYLDWAASLGHRDIVIYFLSKGNESDIRKCYGTSKALHQAAENGHYDCVQVLCGAGLSPKTKDPNGKTVLRLAVENNHSSIVDFLLEYNNDEASFNELELLASSYMVSVGHFGGHEQPDRMRSLLQQSLIKRLLLNIPKKVAQSIAAYESRQECQSIDEFDQIQHNDDRLRLEALLIRERILLPEKDETFFSPLYQRGTMLVEQDKFDRCFHLWLHIFQLHQQMELDTDLQNFVWLFCRILASGIPVSVNQFLEAGRLVFHSSQQKSHK